MSIGKCKVCREVKELASRYKKCISCYRAAECARAKEYRGRNLETVRSNGRDRMRIARKVDERYKETGRRHSKKYYYSHIDECRIKALDRTKKFLQTDDGKIYNRLRVSIRRLRALGNGGVITKREWIDLCEFYDNKCLCCGWVGDYKTLTIDHVIPVSRGGRGDISNIQPLCGRCNTRKNARNIDYRKRTYIPEVKQLSLFQLEG